MRDIYYSIEQFYWSKESRTFYQDAWEIFDDYHQYAFPNMKGQFFIKNFDTGGFRRFRLVEETAADWVFESEDGIKCIICYNPDHYDIQLYQQL